MAKKTSKGARYSPEERAAIEEAMRVGHVYETSWELERALPDEERHNEARSASENDHSVKAPEQPTSGPVPPSRKENYWTARPVRIRLAVGVRVKSPTRDAYDNVLFLDSGADTRLTLVEVTGGYQLFVAGQSFTTLIPWSSIQSVETESL